MFDRRKAFWARAALVAAAAMAAIPATAQTVYTDRTAFDAAATTTLQNFNGAPTSSTATAVTFTPVTFSCTGSTYCPGFFGTRNLGNSGSGSVFFATPDTATFTFDAPITAFGIDLRDVGTNGATNFSAIINGTSYLLQSDYSSGVPFFFGYTGSAFSSVSFTGTQVGDGVDFDDLAFGASSINAAVPEPSTWAMMLIGFGAVGFSMRRRRGTSAVASAA